MTQRIKDLTGMIRKIKVGIQCNTQVRNCVCVFVGVCARVRVYVWGRSSKNCPCKKKKIHDKSYYTVNQSNSSSDAAWNHPNSSLICAFMCVRVRAHDSMEGDRMPFTEAFAQRVFVLIRAIKVASVSRLIAQTNREAQRHLSSSVTMFQVLEQND